MSKSPTWVEIRAKLLDQYQQKLQELAALPTNWDSYSGFPPTEEALKAAERCLRSAVTICPMSSGGIQLNWANAEVNFLPDGTQDLS